MSARAIVLAAGMGTRMKSTVPKVLHELCGRPMLWYTLRALQEAGVDDLIIVTSPESDVAIAALAAHFGGQTVVQMPQRGTGHALQIALDTVPVREGTVLVAHGDMPLVVSAIFEDVLAAVDADAGTALALVTARMPLPSNFGRVIRHAGAVVKIVEARDASASELAVDEMNAAIYAFDEHALRTVIGGLTDNNAQRELYLTDTLALLIAQGKRIVPVPCADYHAVLGVNDRVELANVGAILNRALCERHQRAGVTIVDPATTFLEPDVVIDRDTTILPNTMLGGATQIGGRSIVGPNARLHDAIIGEDCVIRESVVLSSRLANGVSVGPFAHLRGGSVVEGDVHIGNFVELKNTTMRAGAKAGHLAYLGDGDIGARANIGAGTIFCNYDGVRKHRTTIGAGAFIGSNSALVAPITIGEGAATGAGAVVIRDVAAGERVVGNPARALPTKAT